MRQRTSAEFSGLTESLVHEIERAGYAVSVHRVGDCVEMHAVQLKESCAHHIARVANGDREEHLHRCVREPAHMLEIELGER